MPPPASERVAVCAPLSVAIVTFPDAEFVIVVSADIDTVPNLLSPAAFAAMFPLPAEIVPLAPLTAPLKVMSPAAVIVPALVIAFANVMFPLVELITLLFSTVPLKVRLPVAPSRIPPLPIVTEPPAVKPFVVNVELKTSAVVEAVSIRVAQAAGQSNVSFPLAAAPSKKELNVSFLSPSSCIAQLFGKAEPLYGWMCNSPNETSSSTVMVKLPGMYALSLAFWPGWVKFTRWGVPVVSSSQLGPNGQRCVPQ